MLFINWLVAAIAVLVTSYVLPGVHVAGLLAALIVVVILGLINAVIRPLLLLLTLPVNILTLGLFTLVINALMVLLASAVVPGLQVDGFWWALLFSVLLTLVNGFFNNMRR